MNLQLERLDHGHLPENGAHLFLMPGMPVMVDSGSIVTAFVDRQLGSDEQLLRLAVNSKRRAGQSAPRRLGEVFHIFHFGDSLKCIHHATYLDPAGRVQLVEIELL